MIDWSPYGCVRVMRCEVHGMVMVEHRHHLGHEGYQYQVEQRPSQVPRSQHQGGSRCIASPDVDPAAAPLDLEPTRS